MTKAALYVRVSTCSQTTENQTRELRAACEQRGWTITAEYEDVGISGAKDRTKRPGFDALWNAVVAGDIDVVAVWAVDRLARSLSQLVSFMDDLRAAGSVNLYIHTQGIDTTTPGGMAMFQMVGVFAQFEREMIRTRVKAGLARAKENGAVFGRGVSPKEDEVRGLVREGLTYTQIRRRTGVGHSIIKRLRDEENARSDVVR